MGYLFRWNSKTVLPRSGGPFFRIAKLPGWLEIEGRVGDLSVFLSSWTKVCDLLTHAQLPKMYAGDEISMLCWEGSLRIWVVMNMNKTFERKSNTLFTSIPPLLHQTWPNLPFDSYGARIEHHPLWVSGDLALLQEKLRKSFNLSLSGVIDIRTPLSRGSFKQLQWNDHSQRW